MWKRDSLGNRRGTIRQKMRHFQWTIWISIGSSLYTNAMQKLSSIPWKPGSSSFCLSSRNEFSWPRGRSKRWKNSPVVSAGKCRKVSHRPHTDINSYYAWGRENDTPFVFPFNFTLLSSIRSQYTGMPYLTQWKRTYWNRLLGTGLYFHLLRLSQRRPFSADLEVAGQPWFPMRI